MVSILSVCDNTVDMLLLDEGPARRPGLARGGGDIPTLPAPTPGRAAGARLGRIAQHGFSVLVEVRKGDTVRPAALRHRAHAHGMRREPPATGRDIGDVEVVVCSHGHFDHATGLSGLVDRLGRTNLPVVIQFPKFLDAAPHRHPGRRAVRSPSTTSRRALEDAGFDVVRGPPDRRSSSTVPS
ncbi:MAG: MBL fold metallo-hydrolase [Acidimicrobiia bacterium]|nr:MBL fold metallo-hydrolase [Acidimicrobiia bacterium]